jgi:CheY-like chemotaxis protein
MMLLDLMMPILDGWEVARRLAADLSLPRVPFCVLSACLDDPPAESKYVFNKPFELRELLAIVRHCCGSVPRLGRRTAGLTPTTVPGQVDRESIARGMRPLPECLALLQTVSQYRSFRFQFENLSRIQPQQLGGLEQQLPRLVVPATSQCIGKL